MTKKNRSQTDLKRLARVMMDNDQELRALYPGSNTVINHFHDGSVHNEVGPYSESDKKIPQEWFERLEKLEERVAALEKVHPSTLVEDLERVRRTPGVPTEADSFAIAMRHPHSYPKFLAGVAERMEEEERRQFEDAFTNALKIPFDQFLAEHGIEEAEKSAFAEAVPANKLWGLDEEDPRSPYAQELHLIREATKENMKGVRADYAVVDEVAGWKVPDKMPEVDHAAVAFASKLLRDESLTPQERVATALRADQDQLAKDQEALLDMLADHMSIDDEFPEFTAALGLVDGADAVLDMLAEANSPEEMSVEQTAQVMETLRAREQEREYHKQAGARVRREGSLLHNIVLDAPADLEEMTVEQTAALALELRAHYADQAQLAKDQEAHLDAQATGRISRDGSHFHYGPEMTAEQIEQLNDVGTKPPTLESELSSGIRVTVTPNPVAPPLKAWHDPSKEPKDSDPIKVVRVTLAPPVELPEYIQADVDAQVARGEIPPTIPALLSIPANAYTVHMRKEMQEKQLRFREQRAAQEAENMRKHRETRVQIVPTEGLSPIDTTQEQRGEIPLTDLQVKHLERIEKLRKSRDPRLKVLAEEAGAPIDVDFDEAQANIEFAEEIERVAEVAAEIKSPTTMLPDSALRLNKTKKKRRNSSAF